MINPKTITSDSAAGRPKKEARVPIRGGPTRNPKYPMAVTAAIPGPAPVLCLPADPNKMGTRLERPNPTKINPTIATSGVRIRRARARPAAADSPLRRRRSMGPSADKSPSPRNRGKNCSKRNRKQRDTQLRVAQVEFLFDNRNMTCPDIKSQAISKKNSVGCSSRRLNRLWAESPLDRDAEIGRLGVGT